MKNLTTKQRIEILEYVIKFIENNLHKNNTNYETALNVLKYIFNQI